MIKNILFGYLAIVTLFLNLSAGSIIDKDTKSIIKKVLFNLDTIESASYFSYSESYAPGDTTPFVIGEKYCKMYSNPADTFVGAAFVNLLVEDTTKMRYCYDGSMRSRINWKNKTIEIDSFYHNPYPFRTVLAPFFTRIKTLFEYTLNTRDSIELSYEDYGDSLCINILIFDKIIEVIGNHMIVSPPLQGTNEGKVSRYFIWISKKDWLPYKFKRVMPHDVSVDIISNVKFNIGNRKDFSPVNYFPKSFDVLYGKNKKISPPEILIGKNAPDWKLMLVNRKDSLRLYGIKSKVVLIEFTSITCGPCHLAIPFLNSLSDRYSSQNLDVVSIEGFISNNEVLKKYMVRNGINYKFLMSTEKVTQSYHIKSIPVFLVLDEKKVVKKVFTGYQKGVTDEKICRTIDELLESEGKR